MDALRGFVIVSVVVDIVLGVPLCRSWMYFGRMTESFTSTRENL